MLSSFSRDVDFPEIVGLERPVWGRGLCGGMWDCEATIDDRSSVVFGALYTKRCQEDGRL